MQMRIFVPVLIFTTVCILGAPNIYGDTIQMKYTGEKFVGKILEDDGTSIRFKLKTGGSAVIPKSCVASIKIEEIPDKELYTDVDIYFQKLSSLNQEDPRANLELAEWCNEHSTPENRLSEMAVKHLKAARELDPQIAEKASKDIKDEEDKEAKRIYDIATAQYDAGEINSAEMTVLLIVNSFPDSSYAEKGTDLMVKIWGPLRAARIMNKKDDLPAVAFSQEDLSSVMSHLSEGKMGSYFTKCLEKGTDYEDRSKEVSRDRRKYYYVGAINSFTAVLSAKDDKLANLAVEKQQDLLKKYFNDNPIPSSTKEYDQVFNFIRLIKEEKVVKSIALEYLKRAEKLIKDAKRLKQPKKAEKARMAYFSYAIANSFCNEDKIKGQSAVGMAEAQQLERARK